MREPPGTGRPPGMEGADGMGGIALERTLRMMLASCGKSRTGECWPSALGSGLEEPHFDVYMRVGK